MKTRILAYFMQWDHYSVKNFLIGKYFQIFTLQKTLKTLK